MKARILAVMVFLLVVVACAPQLTPGQQQYKALCKANDGEWMKMATMQEGRFTSKEACLGCMADMMTMTCTMDEYKAWIDENERI